MNNQNQYQAPQQPQYQPPQQPQYQPQYQPPKKQSAGLGGIVDMIIKILPILVITFLGIGAVGFLYYFIMGIVNAADYGFELFLNGVANAIGTVAKYAFYAAITSVLHKFLNKK